MVVPAFGKCNPLTLETCLSSIKKQEDIDIELILAEQTYGAPLHGKLASQYNAKHVIDLVEQDMGKAETADPPIFHDRIILKSPDGLIVFKRRDRRGARIPPNA